MSPDDLEQRIQNVPLRPLPQAWRHEILSQARAGVERATGSRPTDSRFSNSVGSLLSRLHEKLSAPWTVFATAWAIILLLNAVSSWLATSSDPHSRTTNARIRGQVVAEARRYQAEVLELVRLGEANGVAADGPEPVAPRPPLRPRSDAAPVPARSQNDSETSVA